MSTTLSRRQFIRITATLGALCAGGVGWAALRDRPSRIRETRVLMGSVASLTLFSHDEGAARAAITAAFDTMETLESVFSRHRADSQLSRLNETGHLPDAHPALWAVLARAIAYGDLTGGAFDVTVEPVCELYRKTVAAGHLPGPDALAAARARVDYRQIALDGAGIRLGRAGMAITLDGIGKGYIIDQGAAALAAHGCGQILLEVGGDLQTLGAADEGPWRVGIRPPGMPADPLVVQLSGAAIATSGDYLNSYTPDHHLHHILDPDSGVSPGELSSVSVIAPTVCDADALATALMVMGWVRGAALVDTLAGVEALAIGKDGVIRQTAQFPLLA